MKAKLVSIWRSLVEIRPGEGRVAWLMFVYLFLVIATFAVVKPVRSSLFLQKFGARNLPYIYLATAVLAALVAWIHSRLLDRFNIVTVQVLTHLFFISNLVLFWFAFREETAWLSAAFFLWVNIFTVTANTLFWMFANHYYNPREAKRLYGFINAGGTVGAVASGLAVSAVVRDIGTETLLLVCSAILGVCILLTYLISGFGKDRFALEETPYADKKPDPRKVSPKPESSPLRTLFTSSYAKYIALALGLSLVISTLIDYQFNVIVEGNYPDKDAKTAFFSSFMAGVNALSFVLQFFLTSPLLRRLGIGFSLLLLPLTLFSGASWMALYPGLAAAMFLKISDGSVRYSIEQSTRDVLYLPIPNRVMGKLKAFVDVFVQRLAKGVGSLLILAVTTWWVLDNQVLSYVSILLAFVWVTCALLLRKEYPQQLKGFLAREHLGEEQKFVRLLDETTRAELLAALESGEEETALYSLELLEGSRDPKLASLLRKLVRQGSPRLQARALHLLADLGDASVIREAENLLHLKSVEVQEEAIHYLCASSPGAMQKMQEFLRAKDLSLRAAAIACMVNCGGIEGERMAQPMFKEMLSQEGEKGVAARKLLARTLRHIRPPSAFHSHLRPLLQDPSDEVSREALATAQHILRRDFVPLIIEKLAAPQLSSDALETLKAYGGKVLGTLRDYMDDESISVGVRRLLPSVFVQVGTEEAAHDLVSSLHQSDAQLRHEVIKALNKIKDRVPGLKLERIPIEEILAEEVQQAYRLLRELYFYTSPGARSESAADDPIAAVSRSEEQYRSSIERIFRLLGLLFNQEDIYTGFRGLSSPRADLKANAVELLETLLPGQLKKVLLPLVDDEIPIQEKLKMGESVLAPTRPMAAA